MSLDYELLRVLHHKLKLQTEYQSQIERGPKKINLAKATETRFEEDLAAAKEVLKKARLMAHDRQLQLSEREAKIEDLKGKRNACESNREYQLLNDQIAADEQANAVLSDEILELLEKLDQFEINEATATENFAKSRIEAKNIIEKVEKELVIQRAELEELVEAITKLEAQIPAEIKSDYQRQVRAKADDALAVSNQETCGNCNQRLNAQIKSDLAMQKPVFCDACGSLMYTAAKSTAGS